MKMSLKSVFYELTILEQFFTVEGVIFCDVLCLFSITFCNGLAIIFCYSTT